jgi:hypothetical protein
MPAGGFRSWLPGPEHHVVEPQEITCSAARSAVDATDYHLCCRLELSNLDLACCFPRLRQVVGDLHAQPSLGGTADPLLEAKRISGVIPARSFTIAESVLRDTPRPSAAAVIVNPRPSVIASLTIRPGWQGFFIVISLAP